MKEVAAEIFSGLFGKRWFLFSLIALFIFFACGVWLLSTPAYETMYNHSPLPVVRTDKASVHCHIFEIGNTGRKAQESVEVIFYTDAFSDTAMAPKVSNFGMSDRKTETRESNDTTIIDLGKLEPDKRVEIQLVYIHPIDETPYEWDDIFINIEATQGKVVEGDPGWTTVGRMLYAIFG